MPAVISVLPTAPSINARRGTVCWGGGPSGAVGPLASISDPGMLGTYRLGAEWSEHPVADPTPWGCADVPPDASAASVLCVSVVRLKAVVALLGRFPALAGVDLNIDAGEVVLIQGPNGAGKSTLLRLCAGLLRLESGSAEVLGLDLATSRAAVRRRVGLLGHDTALYDELTVAENLEFWAAASRVDRAAVAPALDRLGVSPRLHDVAVSRLSAGQRRRVALAGVVVRRPELWLLDEPHAGLDQSGRDLVDDLVVDAAAAGATVLLASHELDRTVDLASRTVVVAGGMVVADQLRDPEPVKSSGGDGHAH